LRKLGGEVTRAITSLRTMPPEAAQRGVTNVEHQVFSLLIRSRQLLRDNVLDAKQVTIDDLPPVTRERFIGLRGGSAVFVFPQKPGPGPEMDAFVADVRTVAARA